ncbi:MAG: HAD hydrolase-like protein [Akkermansiaceae bacterium]|nr:HAD hydrolase-like protein [Akkermansiaceae bacterium]
MIFDWSGTLVDDMGPTLEATNAVLQRFEQPPMTRDEFRDRFRLPYSEFYEEVLPGVPLEELEEHFREAFRTSGHPVTPLDGTAEFLEWCAAHAIRLFVLTSMDVEAFEEQMHAFGFADHFEKTYAGVLDKRRVIHGILRDHGLRAEETAYVGDMTHDIETAHHGGVTSVGVLSGYDPEARLAAAQPRLLLSCVKSLHAMMESSRRFRAPGAPAAGERIEIRKLRVPARVGVPAGERAAPQDLAVSLQIVPQVPFGALADEIARTVDYDEVAQHVKALAADRPRKLIETLADEIAASVLEHFPAAEVAVEIEKFILPDAEAVAVRTVRRPGDSGGRGG